MVLKRSRVKQGSLVGRCRRGKILFSSDEKFKVGFSQREYLFLEMKESLEYNAPPMKKEVLCIYKKGHNGEKYVDEVRSLNWDLYFRRD